LGYERTVPDDCSPAEVANAMNLKNILFGRCLGVEQKLKDSLNPCKKA
jgi:hypothetical protein